MRYPFFHSAGTSFSLRSSHRAGKASPRMYRCPLLVPLPGCHLVLLLCHFWAVLLLFGFLLSYTALMLPWWAASSASTARLSKYALLSAMAFFTPSECDCCSAQPFYSSFHLSFQGSSLLSNLCGCTSMDPIFAYLITSYCSATVMHDVICIYVIHFRYK